MLASVILVVTRLETIVMKVEHTHQEFSIDHLEMKPRSRLFQPTLIGAGTKDVEGLISYIVRIAAAHSVSPTRLLRKIYAVENPEIAEFLYPSFFNQYSSTVNGLGKYAELFVAHTESLTGAKVLALSTLLPLSDLLPSTGCGLLSDTPKWCPECIQEMLITHNDSYRPLIWSLKFYRACTKHKQPLIDICLHCDRVQPFIPRYPDLSRCAYCYQGLNVRKPGEDFEFTEFDYWVFTALEDLIANLNRFGQVVAANTFVTFIKCAVEHFSKGNQSAFCKSIGLNSWAVKGWLRNNEKPSLPQLLAICYGMDTLPSEIFLKPWDEVFTHQALRRIPEKIVDRAERPLLKDGQLTELKHSITAIANDETDYRPLAIVARQLGHRSTCLKYWFPIESAKISKKFAANKKAIGLKNAQAAIAAVSNIVEEIRGRGEYVSNRKVNDRLLRKGMSLAKPILFRAFKSELKKI